MIEEENILRILKSTKRAVLSDQPYELKNLSNQTIHSAAISQDPDNVIVAVLVYSLGKALERENYRSMEGWQEFYNDILKYLEIAINSLEKKEIEKCRDALGEIRESLNRIDTDLGTYIKDVFRKAEINKAFKLYEHGLSAEQTAKLLGINLWDLASYIGQSTISEANASVSMPIKKRAKLAEDFFE